jgi:hypothetical protein
MNVGLINKFNKDCRSLGLVSAMTAVLRWFINRLKELIGLGDQIQNRRLKLSALLNERFSATVCYGPFKGLQLSRKIWWGKTDRAGMLLGLYEQEVLKSVKNAAAMSRSFVELGAADGYYGVGVLVGGMFCRSYCYETSKAGRETIARNAVLNGVQSRVEIRGAADALFYERLPKSVPDNCVLLVDIEGAEFDIFTTEVIRCFSKSVIIIELHDHFFADGASRLARLRSDAERVFDIEELTTTGRDLSVFPELRTFSDTDRWLICSEGRREMPHWFLMTPREGN